LLFKTIARREYRMDFALYRGLAPSIDNEKTAPYLSPHRPRWRNW
jgi:hypothetical protein